MGKLYTASGKLIGTFPDSQVEVIPKNCEHCIHWEKDMDVLGHEIGSCYRAVLLWDAIGRNEYGEKVLKDAHKSARVFVNDDSGYPAAMYTTSDFYCIDFEERTT